MVGKGGKERERPEIKGETNERPSRETVDNGLWIPWMA